MRRGIVILMLGLLGALIGFGIFYWMGTATPRVLLQSPQPELAWLRHEFNLNEAEFKRISELHAGYLPQCMVRCQRIDRLNQALSEALSKATQVTPEVERLLGERAQVRAACQAEMLNHFFAVGRTMPPEQGRRYLAWVRESTCLHEEPMGHSPASHREMGRPGGQP